MINLLQQTSTDISRASWLLTVTVHKKIRFPLRISSVNVTKSAVSTDLVIFDKEILNGKLHFLCSVNTISAIIHCVPLTLNKHLSQDKIM